MQIIAKELGFEQLGSTGAAFKRAGYTTSFGVGADFENRYEARIQINSER